MTVGARIKVDPSLQPRQGRLCLVGLTCAHSTSMISPHKGAVMHLLRNAALAGFAIALATSSAIAQKAPKGDKKGGDMEFEPESAASTPPSKTLERAIKLYDKKDFFSASIELKKVLEGESGDDAKNKQRAEFFMGKTLYQIAFYPRSMAYSDKVVQAGDNHTYHGAALKWLAALSRVLPETSGILEKIGTYDPAALNDPSLTSVKDELLFLLGRHYYKHGDFDKATSLFQQ